MKTIIFSIYNFFNRKIYKKRKEDKKLSLSKENKYTKNDIRFRDFVIGDHTYGFPKVKVYEKVSKLVIGKYCSIAENVTIILGGEHHTDWVSTYPFSVFFENCENIIGHPKSKGNVIIGNDVWIGYGSTILSGVTIGNGAVIAAESVITKSIPPYTIVGGNPAKIIRYRFPMEIINRLDAVNWWDKSDSEVREMAPFLLSSDIEYFLNLYSVNNLDEK